MNAYKTSRKVFNAKIVGLPLTENATRYRNSVVFIYSDDEKTFRVRAHENEYADAMRDLKIAQDAYDINSAFRLN